MGMQGPWPVSFLNRPTLFAQVKRAAFWTAVLRGLPTFGKSPAPAQSPCLHIKTSLYGYVSMVIRQAAGAMSRYLDPAIDAASVPREDASSALSRAASERLTTREARSCRLLPGERPDRWFCCQRRSPGCAREPDQRRSSVPFQCTYRHGGRHRAPPPPLSAPRLSAATPAAARFPGHRGAGAPCAR